MNSHKKIQSASSLWRQGQELAELVIENKMQSDEPKGKERQEVNNA
jgi:hypothetical protein